MAAEARRERRQGAGGEEEGDRGDRAQDSERLECATRNTNVTERGEVMQVSPTTEQTGRCYHAEAM